MKLEQRQADELVELVFGTCDDLGWWRPKAGVELDLWLGGFRNASDAVGAWDDAQAAIVWTRGAWHAWVWRATTDPGREGVISGGNREGVGRLVHGQYRACWQAGTHHAGRPGAHRALVQTPVARFLCWRDVAVDGALPRGGRVYANAAGVNFHRPYRDGLSVVGDASWMCQVPATRTDHDVVMRLYDEQVSCHPGWTRVSYSLFDVGERTELGPVLRAAGVIP